MKSAENRIYRSYDSVKSPARAPLDSTRIERNYTVIRPVQALVRYHELQYSTGTGLRADVERVQAEMDRCRAALPAAILSRYHTLQIRYGARALAPMERNTCNGCHITQPRKHVPIAEGVYECQSCGRLLYDPEQIDEYELIRR